MNTATLTPPAPTTTRKPRVTFKVAKKETETKTAYPVFNDPTTGNQVVEIAERIKRRSGELEALEGAQKTDKAELKMFTGPFYFKTNQGKSKPPSSISIPTDAGEVLVTFQNRYSKLEHDGPVRAIIGDAHADKFIRQTFSLAIDGEALPDGKEQDIVDEITAVLEKHNCLAAMTAKEENKPTSEFHVARLSLFTPEQNLAIDREWPVVAMVKTKGRGE